MNKKAGISACLFLLLVSTCFAFDPAAGKKGSFAVSKDHEKIISWASDYQNYIPGTNVDAIWQNPKKALGKAEGQTHNIVCLGRGGEITLYFEEAIKNYEGLDFAVFENSYSDDFLELANVYVSSDGVNFAGFETVCNVKEQVSTYGKVNPEDLYNFAGKYRMGFGTGFDLEELKDHALVKANELDLMDIRYVKIVDIVGDGKTFDSKGNPVYDPYPTFGSAGFDLDGVCSLSGVVFESVGDDDDNDDAAKETTGKGFGNEGGCFIETLF